MNNINNKNNEKKETEALMKRLEARFGDVDLDLKLLGLGDNGEQIARELEEADRSATEKDAASAAAAEAAGENDAIADAEAAALMARLGAQFGDLDMSQLGLGVGVGISEGWNNGNGIGNGHGHGTGCGRDSDDESSLEDPTPEELEAWQASQFSTGREVMKAKETEQTLVGGTPNSIVQHRKLLREARAKQLSQEQTKLRLRKTHPRVNPETASGSVLDLLGSDTSVFFGPSTAGILEELVSETTDGDPEILQASWKRLYASYEQGLGFWNLWKALRGYDGPTLLVLRCLPSASKALGVDASSGTPLQTACLGFYTTTPWKESSSGLSGGDTNCEDGDRAFLFSIDEKGHTTSKGNVRFFPVEPTTKEKAPSGYMYCQPSANSDGKRGKTAAVAGLGVGGRPTQPRFHLTETFEDCSCLTYDSGRATRDGDLFACFESKENEESEQHGSASRDEGHSFAKALYCFDVTELEAWGTGGKIWIDHALKERENARDQHVLRYQKINKQMMWDQGTFGSTTNSRRPPKDNDSKRNR
jgi:hypothetical protein